jgi:hypothetical protein
MKVRAGFVSNSSSSSFVVLLPENFLETVDYDKIKTEHEDEDGNFPMDEFKQLLKNFVDQEGMLSEEIYDYDEEDFEFVDILDDLIEPYVVTSIDSGPDEGCYIVLNREKVKELLG